MERQTILVPLDGSIPSQAAIPYAAVLARAKGASVRLLRVVPGLEQYPIFATPEEEQTAIDRLRAQAQAELDAPAAGLRGQGFEISTILANGSPAEEILRDAATAHAAAIVMATRGRGGVQRWMLGSVADKVMRTSTVPTLLVRPPDTETPAETLDLKTILLPLDGSALAETAIQPAEELARATGAELLVLRVEPYLAQTMVLGRDTTYVPDLTDLDEQTADTARDYIKEVCARLGEGIHYRGFIERGFANQILEPFIEGKNVDLVVMSTRGQGGLTRLVIGSTADRLVRAGVPSLLIRPQEVPEQSTPSDKAAATGGTESVAQR